MNEANAKTLTQVLGQLNAAMHNLVDLLQQEHDTLKGLNVDPLNTISQQKNALLDEIDQLNQHLVKQCQAIAPNIKPSDIDHFLSALDTQHHCDLSQQWQTLRELTQQCQKLNTINGQMIVIRRQSAQQALDIIKGKPAAYSNTYSARGHTTSNMTSRTLVATA